VVGRISSCRNTDWGRSRLRKLWFPEVITGQGGGRKGPGRRDTDRKKNLLARKATEFKQRKKGIVEPRIVFRDGNKTGGGEF